MIRRRRDILIGASALSAASGLPMPAISQGLKELRMVTSWPKGSVGMQKSAQRLGEAISSLSGGRFKVTVYAAGDLVRAFEVFDAVSTGVADMYHSSDYYFEARSPALNFFSAVPYGLTANEFNSWINFCGGQELWDEVDADFGIKPLMASNSGVQMGGWFTKEVDDPNDYKGLRYRMPGLGAEVLRRMGATVVNIPGGEIVEALKSGAIDASEWVGPWLDMDLGLHHAADYYYYPGFHEPGTNFTLGINRYLWHNFTDADRTLIEAAAAAELSRSSAEFNAGNVKALKILRENSRIKILRFDDKLVAACGKLAKEVLADIAAKDALTRKVYDGYVEYLAGVMDWSTLSDRSYLETRRMALS
jgi:TRAP-type mannitol/chloroaromatic compound transport system substrate-binding protein